MARILAVSYLNSTSTEILDADFIQFELEPGRVINVSTEDGRLEVRDRNGHILVIEPVVANSVMISSRRP